MDLPAVELGDKPSRHPHCCLSLSTKLLDVLTETCFGKADDGGGGDGPCRTVLSVGSGTGLLEALWQQHLSSPSPYQHRREYRIEGVEVRLKSAAANASAVCNMYLPEQAINAVRSAADVVTSRLAGDEGDGGDVVGVVFVYPRQPELVSRYVRALGDGYGGSGGRRRGFVVVWLGPVADWHDGFKACFDVDDEKDDDDEGQVMKKGDVEVRTLSGEEAGVGEYEMMAVLSMRSRG